MSEIDERVSEAVAVLFAAFGVLMGISGFLGWNLHPDAFAKFLS